MFMTIPRSAIALDFPVSLYFIEYSDYDEDLRPCKGQRSIMKIRSRKLTTSRIADDGSEIGLEFLDQSGSIVTVELPLDQAEAIVMTIPHLLARAVKRKTGDEDARYVFSLDGWSIESTQEQDCLIATLTTSHGFEVCFAIPFEACQTLGRSLQNSASDAVERLPPNKNINIVARDKLN
jgi:hypothetical protein